jgi:hypothetical protein
VGRTVFSRSRGGTQPAPTEAQCSKFHIVLSNRRRRDFERVNA